MEMQARIRHGAEKMQDAMRDMSRWEEQIKNKDVNLRQQGLRSKTVKTKPVVKQSDAKVNNSISSGSRPPVRSGARLSVVHSKPTMTNNNDSNSSSKNTAGEENAVHDVREEVDVTKITKNSNIQKSRDDTKATGDGHTYDKGYKKWESFDVDSALKEVDEDKTNNNNTVDNSAIKQENTNSSDNQSTAHPSPASIITPSSLPAQPPVRSVRSAPLKRAELQPRDVVEKERGNEYYKAGNWSQAVKCYARAIAFNSSNHILYSNRAMALLKLKEFRGAEDDCTKALEIVPTHVKSLTRRGTARTRLGRHRLATVDFARALEIQPGNKGARAELRKNRESVKANARRVPRVRVPIEVVTTTDASNTISIKSLVNSDNAVVTASIAIDTAGATDALQAVADSVAVDVNAVEPVVDSVDIEPVGVADVQPARLDDDVATDTVTDVVADAGAGDSVIQSVVSSSYVALDSSATRITAEAVVTDSASTVKNTANDLVVADSTDTDTVDVVVVDSVAIDVNDADVIATGATSGASTPTAVTSGGANANANVNATNFPVTAAAGGGADAAAVTVSAAVATRDTVMKKAVAKSRSSVSINMSPKSGYEFVRSWRSLKGNETARLAILLKNVGQLTKLLMPVLDPELLSEVIFTCVNNASQAASSTVVDAVNESPDARAKVLYALSQTRSFSTVSMFLDKTDSKRVKKLLEECSGDDTHVALGRTFKC